MAISPKYRFFCGRQDCSDMHSWGPGIRTCCVIHYIIRGKGSFICNGKTHRLTAGQSFLILPYTEIRYFPDRSEPWEYTWIEFDINDYREQLKKIRFTEDGCIIEKTEPEKILSFYEALTALMPAYGNRPCTYDGLIRTVLGVYADLYPASLQNAAVPDFDAALLIIQSSFHRSDFGIPYICEALGISRATLHRCFKKSCDLSPGDFIRNYRIERAAEFLECGSSVKSTAISCGFKDPLYFSKVFTSTVGVSPSEYRRTHKA